MALLYPQPAALTPHFPYTVADAELADTERRMLKLSVRETRPMVAEDKPTIYVAIRRLRLRNHTKSQKPLSLLGLPHEVALAIFNTNAVTAGSHGVGIFPRMARLNHGCAGSFNAVYNFREKEGLLYIHALKDVKVGQVS